ncbi:hypothetical protein [Mesorhizobium sp. L103C105A0]|nr:hypothetical protein [Mesorhizobium sp. L103C105A0]ESZ74625.1 hypothetical protein X726_22160 [Mesorhizobium sp. L103C105A0]
MAIIIKREDAVRLARTLKQKTGLQKAPGRLFVKMPATNKPLAPFDYR